MRNAGTWFSVLCCSAISVFAVSCSVPSRNAAPVGPEKQIVAETSRLAEEQFTLGRFKKSLEIYAQAYDKYHLKGLRRGYLRLSERIRNAADAAYQRKDFAEAGSNYHLLFENGVTTRDFAQSLTFDDAYLGAQIAACSRSLTEIGLMKYREEKLEEAITHWKQVIAFDANNKVVMDAIHRATIQLQQLNAIK